MIKCNKGECMIGGGDLETIMSEYSVITMSAYELLSRHFDKDDAKEMVKFAFDIAFEKAEEIDGSDEEKEPSLNAEKTLNALNSLLDFLDKKIKNEEGNEDGRDE